MEINKRIKHSRKNLKLSQTDFAEKIGMKQTGLSAIEKGKVPVLERNIKNICSEFRISEHWLRTGEGQMYAVHTTALDKLAEEYDLSYPELQLLRNYLSLSMSERTAVLNLVHKICNGVALCTITGEDNK